MAPVEQATTTGQVDAAGTVLGCAFTTDPVWRWLLGGRGDAERRLTRVFTAFTSAAARKDGAQVLVRTDGNGAAIWLPPGGWKAPPADVVRSGPSLVRALGTASVRSLRLLVAVERQHPRAPHWYLEALGLVPQARGKGAGATLLQPVLDRCDDEGVPAYLESSNPRNLSFYARHGFVAGAPLEVPSVCPLSTPMWREPR
jgi:GNAT superfamily N-acetyltransferase